MISAVQAAAVREAIVAARQNLTAGQIADITSAVIELKWHSDADRTKAVSACVEERPHAALPPGKRRRSQQDFGNLHHYADEDTWNVLQRSSAAYSMKLHTIMSLALKCGLRCPTEHTMKWLCTWWQVSCNDDVALHAMEPSTKNTFLKHAKNTFDSMRRSAADPVEYIAKLPDSPLQMQRDHPELFACAFPTSMPVACKLNMQVALSFDQSYACRATAKAIVFGQPHRVPIPGSFSASSNGPVAEPLLSFSPRRSEAMTAERVATQLIRQMELMAASQQRMMEFVMCQGQHGGVGARLPRCLEDRRPVAKPMLALPPPRLEDASPTSLGAPAIEVFETEEDVEGGTAHSAIDEMLDAFQARRLAKATAKAVVAVAKPAAKPKPAAVKPSAKPPAAKPPPAAKVAAKPSAAEPLAVKHAKPAGKPPAPKPPVGKAPAAKGKGKGKGAPIGVYGCSKCRWSEGGCGQRRSAAFRGFRWNPTIG